MKAHLLYRDRDFDWKRVLYAAASREAARAGRRYRDATHDRHPRLPWNAEALIQDLELNSLFTAMAREDDCVFSVARNVIITGAQNDLDTIRYRQDVLRDCLNNTKIVKEIYALAVAIVDKEGNNYLSPLMRYPDHVLRWSTELLGAMLVSIGKLRKIADTHAHRFQSEGWTTFFATIRDALSDAYIARVRDHLAQLKFRRGVYLGARLGRGNKGVGYVLHPAPEPSGSWLTRLVKTVLPWLFAPGPPTYGFTLHPRDETGFRLLGDLRNRGIGIAAASLGQSADHVRDFFAMLKAELAFYIGCLNLHRRLSEKHGPTCMPMPASPDDRRLSFRGLHDVCLTLTLSERAVGNDVNADGKDFVIVTGANQGGKSTFLRGVGVAQLMMQSGMFVPAEAFCSSVCDGLFTHYKREEDAGMKSGKLDEELKRMSDIIDHVTPHSMILSNESFAATNEREGSEIARQITSALLERRIKMVFVTHLYEFARGVHERNTGHVLFLRAARKADGTRTFKLIEGEPLRTSFGEDLYDGVFVRNRHAPSRGRANQDRGSDRVLGPVADRPDVTPPSACRADPRSGVPR